MLNESNKALIASVLFVMSLTACVQSYTIPTHRVSDSSMHCGETAQRLAELNAIKKLVLKEKNSKNLVAGVLFFPAVSGNKNNFRQTIAAVNARKAFLSDLYQANECVHRIPVYTTEQIKQMINNNQVRELES